MGFQQGISGLNAAAQNLDVIGNNVANANTVGYKSSRALFSDVYANALTGGSGDKRIGLGTMVQGVQQSFSQGTLTMTQNPLDMAINGTGFFRLNAQGSVYYTRNGQFHLDKDGFIVNPDGNRLTGYNVDTEGKIILGSAQDMKLDTTDIQPKPTDKVTVMANLDSRLSPITNVNFDPTNSETYNNASAMTVYDSLGGSHTATMYFVKRAANSWDVYSTFDGTVVNGGASLGKLKFASNGGLDETSSALPWTYPQQTVSGADLFMPSLSFTGTAQVGGAFSITELKQNGYAPGNLSGLAIGDDGLIMGRYSNGQSQVKGQVVLASFKNNNGLVPVGGNLLAESADSGPPVTNTPKTAVMGTLQSGAVEDSNVDLTAELVNLITAQRVYQANAQTVKAQDTILQTIVNLR